VSSLVGASYLGGRRPGVVGERGRGGEPGRPTGSPDQTTCGDRADADGAGRGAPRSCEEFADLTRLVAICLRTRSASPDGRT
jgi:hypothetical protein